MKGSLLLVSCYCLQDPAQDLKTTPASSFHTHLPSGPWTRVGSKWPRVETGDRLSRIAGGNAHALIGGEFIRSWTIISRGGNRQLQRQGQAHSWWTASTEGQEAHQQPKKCREGRRKEGKELILQKNRERRRNRRREQEMWRQTKEVARWCTVWKVKVERLRCTEVGEIWE